MLSRLSGEGMSMLNSKHLTQTLVRYWQEGLWQTIYNLQPLQASQLVIAWQCPRQDIMHGVLSIELATTEPVAVWVAPLVFCKQGLTPEYWIPLWLPAELYQQQLRLRTDSALPWVPANQFDASLQGPFTAERSVVDDWLRFDYLTPDNQVVFSNWSDYLNGCIEALDTFSEQPWQETLAKRGFQLSDTSYVWQATALIDDTEPLLSSLLEQYCNLSEVEKNASVDEENSFAQAASLCGVMSETLVTEESYHAILQILARQTEPLLAIQASIGSDKLACLSALVASTMVQKLLAKQALPKIALLTPQTGQYAKLTSALNSSKTPVSFEALQQTYAEYEQALAMLNTLLMEEQNESLLVDLQQEDESLEKILQDLFAKQEALKPKSRFKRCLSFFYQDKKKVAAMLSLSEQIRQCKIKRTKIHQAIVRVVELINERSKVEKAWQAWSQKMMPGVLASRQSMQFAISHKLFNMALAYWQQHEPTTQWFTINPNAVQAYDLLIIDSAHRYLPQQIAPYLTQAKRAIFMGDNQEYEAMPAISSIAEERALAKHQLQDEDIIEQMHYKGMLQSIGNAFQVALANSNVISCQLPSRILYHPAINQVLRINKKTLQVTEKFNEGDGLHLLDKPGNCEKQGNEFVNELQAAAIVDWLLQGPLRARLADIQIMTPFNLQQQVLLAKLQAAGIACPVYDFQNLPSRVCDYVIFSPVMTLGMQRPFLFDRGEQHFYRMMVRASRGFWIVGDKRIFDPKTHSPSGQIAKHLFGKVQPVLSPI